MEWSLTEHYVGELSRFEQAIRLPGLTYYLYVPGHDVTPDVDDQADNVRRSILPDRDWRSRYRWRGSVHL
jgi:hypothetical protein